MSTATPAKRERIGREIGAWSCVLGGVVLAALAALLPAWREVAQLEAQRRVLAILAGDLQRQQHSYEQMRHALSSDDPIVLEHLAYHYLGLKPVHAGMVRDTAGPANVRFVSIDHWLHRPRMQPQERTDKYTGERSGVAAVTGRWRGAGLILLAGGCLGLGLYLSAGAGRRQGPVSADHSVSCG